MYRTLDDFAVKGKRVLVRLDLNVPMKDGVVLHALLDFPYLREGRAIGRACASA